ncbi:MAG: cytochrome c3 family protein [Thermoanaerobaculia bacterium]
MRTRFLLPGGILLVVALLLLVGLVASPALASPAAAAKKGDPLAESVCANCHGDQVQAFLSNPHNRGLKAKGWREDAVCEACHTGAPKHADAGGDVALVKSLKGVTGAEACLTCHARIGNFSCANCSPVGAQASQGRLIDTASHAVGAHTPQPAVNCLNCHSIHASEFTAPKLLKKKQLDLCESCHPVVVASFRNKPYAHHVGRGGIDCTSCHEPHGRPGRDSLKLTRSGELPCLSCHSEKKGPFVFPHGNYSGDCLTCHEPHGSNNPKMLKRSQVFQVCLECHSRMGATVIGSQPPAIHNVNQPRWQNCTTCHTAIHGSNRDPQLLK